MTLSRQLSLSHIFELIPLSNVDEINYYCFVANKYNLSVRQLRERIKLREYHRLSDETKTKLINNVNLELIDNIPEPIIIKSDREVKGEKVLQKVILEDVSSFLESLGNGFTFIKNEYKIKIGNSFIFGRVPPEINQDSDEEGWNIKALTDKIAWCATHGIELIIIDHLDYLDRDNPNESDIAHITELMKAIRKAQELGSAIVAFSHLRKFAGSKNETVVPNEDEFIGSSNKVKQATQVILLAPEYKQQDNNCGTWCCIRKNRYGGIKYQAAKMFFNPLTETYNQNYEMFNINYSGTKAEQIDKTGLQTINKTSI